MANPQFSIIIPVYNEAIRLPRTLAELGSFLKGQAASYECIFVDDGSTDRSALLIEQVGATIPLRLIKQPHNQGKGWAVRTGMLAATGTYRAFLDADLATPPTELVKLFAALSQGADVAIGSRIQANGVDLRRTGLQPQPWLRQVLGKVFRMVATRPFLGNIRDSQCGAKAFTARAAERLFSAQQLHRWTFDIEILYLARRDGLQVVEVPVQWQAQPGSKLQPSLQLAIHTLKELAQIGWLHRGNR